MTASRRAILESQIEAGRLEIIELDQDEVNRANTLGDLAARHIDAYSNTGAARKEKYHSLARRKLRKVANLLGLTAKDYRLSTNRGGIAVCGETTLHMDKLYIQVSQSAIGPGREILFRNCDGRTDYCGKQNHFVPARRLDDVADFLDSLRRAGVI
jgi:hypothetical protein